MVIFYVQAVSSISLTVCSVSALCRLRMKAVSDLHRGLVGRCCQSQPPLWVSCALAWAPPPTVCPAVHSEGAGVPGPLSLSISTDAGKWVPRK